MNVIHGRVIFSPYMSNCKRWKDKFLQVRGNAQCSKVVYEEDGTYSYLINWTSDPTLIMRYNPNKLSATEREAVYLLKKLHTMWVSNLFKYEGDLDKLVDFLSIGTLMRPYS